jgi:endogenous inhibitor of DNA gyrase (YacG/DUF329 family)
MIKNCLYCVNDFKTKDSRQKFCSKKCADVNRGANVKKALAKHTEVPIVPPVTITKSLPPPEELPAPYAKRVHDMWATLIGELDNPTRIA